MWGWMRSTESQRIRTVTKFAGSSPGHSGIAFCSSVMKLANESRDNTWLPTRVHLPSLYGRETRKRPRADVVRRTYLNPSSHRTGTTTVPRPKPEGDPRYQNIPFLDHQETHPSKQAGATFPHQAIRSCDRAMGQSYSLTDPSPGLSPQSIPLPLHWRVETCSQTFPPRVMEFFSWSCVTCRRILQPLVQFCRR